MRIIVVCLVQSDRIKQIPTIALARHLGEHLGPIFIFLQGLLKAHVRRDTLVFHALKDQSLRL